MALIARLSEAVATCSSVASPTPYAACVPGVLGMAPVRNRAAVPDRRSIEMWHEAMVGRPFPRIQAYWTVRSSVSIMRYRPFVPMLA